MANQMKYEQIPYVNKPVSRIVYGALPLVFLNGMDVGALLDDMLSMGVTTFDTARNYVGSEIVLGRWMESRGNRDDVVLLSKCGHPSMFGRKRVNEKEMKKDLQKSLRQLQTDHIDIYLLHRDDPEVPVGEIVEIFNEMHANGSIGAFGGSNWTYRRIAEANEYAYAHNLIPFTVSSPNFGLANQVQDPWGGGCETISGPEHQEDRQWYQKTGMPVVAYSSLGRGFFSGKLKYEDRENAANILDQNALRGYGYPENFERLRRCEEVAAQKGVTVPQLALAWIFAQELNPFAVISTTSKARMEQNIQALDIALTPEEVAYLDLR